MGLSCLPLFISLLQSTGPETPGGGRPGKTCIYLSEPAEGAHVTSMNNNKKNIYIYIYIFFYIV